MDNQANSSRQDGSRRPPSSGAYLELLDRTQVATHYLGHSLGQHPVMRQHPDFEELFERAQVALGALGQAIATAAGTAAAARGQQPPK